MSYSSSRVRPEGRSTRSSRSIQPARPRGRAPIGPVEAANVVAAVLIRPSLWLTAIRQLFLLSPDGWLSRPPHLPVPDRAYVRFRLQTMYGDPDHSPDPAEVIAYLRWCRSWQEHTGRYS